MLQPVAVRRPGLTLVELLVVLLILAVLTTVAMVATSGMGDQARYETTQQTLQNVQSAIMGPTNQRAPDGSVLVTGFVADMGRFPQTVDGTSDPLRELWDPTVIAADALYSVQQFPTTVTPNAANSSSPFGLLNPANSPYNASSTNTSVIVSMSCGWRGPYLQLAPGTNGQLLDGWGNPFNSIFQPLSGGTPIVMTVGGQPAQNGQPNSGGTANTIGQQVNVVCSRGADNTLDTVVQSNPYNADQYAPVQNVAPLWSTAAPLTSTPTPLANFSSNAYGSVSVVVQTVNNSSQPVTFGNPIAAGETKPTVRVVLFAPTGGVLDAFILDSSTVVNGTPTLDLNNLPTTSAVDFSLPAPPTAPTLTTVPTAGSLLPGTYFVKYQDMVGTTALAPSGELSFVATTASAPTITMPAPAANVTSRNIYLTPPNGASNTETLYTSLSAASATSYTFATPYLAGGAPPLSTTAVNGTFLNVPIGPRAIQAFQYEAAPGTNNMVVTKRSPLTFIMVPSGGVPTQTLILQ